LEADKCSIFTLEEVRYLNVLSINQLTIEAQKITCITGESGSGKTTLLKLLNHLVDYSQGTITYKGKDLKSLDAVNLRREVIMVPQEPVIFSGTLRDNLLAGLQFAAKSTPNDERLRRELDHVGLDKKLDEDPGTLSGGEKQRLAIARVLLMDPEVMLLDEPTSALDEETGEKVISRVKDHLRDRGKTLVMVTHEKHLAEKLADVIIALHLGTINGVREVA